MTFKTPLDALKHGINKGGWPSMLSARKPRKRWQGKPGEIIENLSAETREFLKNLKSDDITEDKVTKEVAHLSADNEWDRQDYINELKSKFDQKIIRSRKFDGKS